MRKVTVTAMMAVVAAVGIATGMPAGQVQAGILITHPPDPCRAAAVMSVRGGGRLGGHCLNPQPLPPG